MLYVIIMLINYIYLLQEREFVNKTENIYKIGRTKKENLQRFNQYPKGSKLLFQMICNDCINVEKNVLKMFKDKFNQRNDIGLEYFEGDYHMMIDIIYLTIKNEDIEGENVESEYVEDEEKVKLNLLCEKISKIFPDYKNDESFGGNKKYIKFNMINQQYSVCYINPFLMDNLHYYYENQGKSIFDEYIIIQYDINNNVADRLQYFNKLISKKTINIDKIYDINSSNFIDKINKTKLNLKIENYNEFNLCTSNIKIYCKISEKLRQMFHCNMIINKCLYSVMVKEDDNYVIFKKFKNLKDFDYFRVDIGNEYYIITKIYKINSKFYDYKTYLRKYTPYLIRWNKENNYYILNRDHEYIGLNVKYIEYDKKGECYLFNDGNVPFENNQHLIKMRNKYEKIIKEKELNECLNKNEFTQNIIHLIN